MRRDPRHNVRTISSDNESGDANIQPKDTASPPVGRCRGITSLYPLFRKPFPNMPPDHVQNPLFHCVRSPFLGGRVDADRVEPAAHLGGIAAAGVDTAGLVERAMRIVAVAAPALLRSDWGTVRPTMWGSTATASRHGRWKCHALACLIHIRELRSWCLSRYEYNCHCDFITLDWIRALATSILGTTTLVVPQDIFWLQMFRIVRCLPPCSVS